MFWCPTSHLSRVICRHWISRGIHRVLYLEIHILCVVARRLSCPPRLSPKPTYKNQIQKWSPDMSKILLLLEGNTPLPIAWLFICCWIFIFLGWCSWCWWRAGYTLLGIHSCYAFCQSSDFCARRCVYPSPASPKPVLALPPHCWHFPRQKRWLGEDESVDIDCGLRRPSQAAPARDDKSK